MAGEEDSADELEALEQELEALDAEQAPEFPEQGLMSMEFMKRGMKKSEALMKAKEDEDDRRLLEAAGWAPEEEDERSATRELTEEEKKEKVRPWGSRCFRVVLIHRPAPCTHEGEGKEGDIQDWAISFQSIRDGSQSSQFVEWPCDCSLKNRWAFLPEGESLQVRLWQLILNARKVIDSINTFY